MEKKSAPVRFAVTVRLEKEEERENVWRELSGGNFRFLFKHMPSQKEEEFVIIGLREPKKKQREDWRTKRRGRNKKPLT